jgi:hypothetical protein
MRHASRLIGCTAALFAASCAEQRPPPPAHPTIEGDWDSVSHADIHAAMKLVREDVAKQYGSSLPMYRVVVVDRDHIQVCYWPSGDTEICAELYREHGKWRRPRVGEPRTIITAPNVPTG